AFGAPRVEIALDESEVLREPRRGRRVLASLQHRRRKVEAIQREARPAPIAQQAGDRDLPIAVARTGTDEAHQGPLSILDFAQVLGEERLRIREAELLLDDGPQVGIRPVVVYLWQVVDDELLLETPLLVLGSPGVVRAGNDTLGRVFRIAAGVARRRRHASR